MSLVQKLCPAAIVQAAGAQSQEAFVTAHGVKILLVRVQSAASDVATGLLAASTSGGPPPTPTEAIGYETVTTTVHSAKADGRLRAPPRSLTIAGVRKTLGQGLHVIVPLRKRPDAPKPFAGRISVGRARNNDIVLRDPSVSKFHAWFECDEENNFFLGDARSKNTTKLNGHRIGGPGMTPLHAGDELQFGGIGVLLCDTWTLWQAIVERG